MVRSYSMCVLDKSRKQINCSITDRGICVALLSSVYDDGFLTGLTVENFSLIGAGLAHELTTFMSRSFVIANGANNAPLDLLFDSCDNF